MKYHVTKASRVYAGKPYKGPSSAGVALEFCSRKDAELFILNSTNPVGWVVTEVRNGMV